MEDTETVADLKAQLEAMRAATQRERQERRTLLHHAADQLDRLSGLLRLMADQPALPPPTDAAPTRLRNVAIQRAALVLCTEVPCKQKNTPEPAPPA